jgi:hypothetical protein
MKGKFGIVALLFSSITFAAPVSTPNQLSDTPIISGGGTVSGGGICRAYQTNGEAVPLSGGETLVFYGGGGSYHGNPTSYGGYLSTKSNYSGTAYVRVKMGNCRRYFCSGGAIGLFARNTDSKNDFIAGVGAGGSSETRGYTYCHNGYDNNAVSGGGWLVKGVYYIACGSSDYSADTGNAKVVRGGSVYDSDGLWFTTYFWRVYTTPGFHSADFALGAASSISAWYNSYTRDYTSPATSLTITGGGYYGRTYPPTLYVCN